MILPLLVWLLQDILQLTFMGIFLVPEIFFLALVFAGLQPDNERGHAYGWYITVGFMGGLFWDLRWTNIPGLTAGLYGFLLALIFITWHQIPVQGRGHKTFALCAPVAQFISAVVHALSWTVANSVVIRLFLIQQLLSIAIILLLSFMYKKAIYRHV